MSYFPKLLYIVGLQIKIFEGLLVGQSLEKK